MEIEMLLVPDESVSGEKRIQLPWFHPCCSSKPKGQG